MSLFSIDVEADGPIPHVYSMVQFGAVRVDTELKTTFSGLTAPVSNTWSRETILYTGLVDPKTGDPDVARKLHESFPDPQITMQAFATWIEKVNKNGRPVFITDNLAFDWQWINFYFHKFYGKNPFGFSGRRIGDLYAGMQRDMYVRWKHLRKTKHTHSPVDDAMGNAEALLAMKDMGLKLSGL